MGRARPRIDARIVARIVKARIGRGAGVGGIALRPACVARAAGPPGEERAEGERPRTNIDASLDVCGHQALQLFLHWRMSVSGKPVSTLAFASACFSGTCAKGAPSSSPDRADFGR